MKGDGPFGNLFGSMPYSGGMGLKFINWEEANAETVRQTVFENLEKIKETLAHISATQNAQVGELLTLQKQREAIRAFLGIGEQS